MSMDDIQTALAALKTAVVGRRIELVDAVDSTNRLLAQRARAGEPEGLVALADEQLAGKGRRGRSWSSPPGSSILCSVLLRPTWLSLSQAFTLTMLAAVAAAEALEQAAGLAIEVKWPNDLQISGRKLGGILVEIEGRNQELTWAIIGCGININWDPGDSLGGRATSLQRELGKPIERGSIARSLLERIDHHYARLPSSIGEALLAQWRRRLTTLGQPVNVDVGGRQLSGWAVDVDDQGALLVRDDYGYIHRFLSGDVSVRSR